ncbi:MAG: hypothetical protein WEB53_06325 [Akkermansiaceae bacterium]
MIGIRSFNLRHCLWLVFAHVVASSALADGIALKGNNSLSGRVLSINEEGVVELSSVLSPEPVFLNAESVEKVEFSPPAESLQSPGAMVELVNGDMIPASLEALDEKFLTIDMPDVGPLELPRAVVKSVQFGIHKRKLIYAGPRNMEEWLSGGDGVRNWDFGNKALVANGPAYATRTFETPTRFVLRFNLKWQGNPNFQIYFADPLNPRGDASDRYYLQFGGAGLELKREAAKGNRYTTVILSNRTPDLCPDQQLEVEVRVDRKASRLHLFLNGEPEGAGIDPLPAAPIGKGISLVSNGSNGNEIEIRGIEILELDDSKIRHRSEDRGDPKADSLISRDDDRWGGRLTSIRKSADGLVFAFKSDFQEEPLEIIETDVSTVFFAAVDAPEVAKDGNPFVLRLQENGLLRVSSCYFTETTVTATHPLLGQLSIRRSGVTAMERLSTATPGEPEK